VRGDFGHRRDGRDRPADGGAEEAERGGGQDPQPGSVRSGSWGWGQRGPWPSCGLKPPSRRRPVLETGAGARRAVRRRAARAPRRGPAFTGVGRGREVLAPWSWVVGAAAKRPGCSCLMAEPYPCAGVRRDHPVSAQAAEGDDVPPPPRDDQRGEMTRPRSASIPGRPGSGRRQHHDVPARCRPPARRPPW